MGEAQFDPNEKFEVRDMRGGDWTWAPNQLIRDRRLGVTDKMVYLGIALHANTYQKAYPARKTLAEISQVSDRSVTRAIAKLKECKYIHVVERAGKPSGYVLLRVTLANLARVGGEYRHHSADPGHLEHTPEQSNPGHHSTTNNMNNLINNSDDDNIENKKPSPAVLDRTRRELVKKGVLPR